MVAAKQSHLVRPSCLQHHQPGQGLQAVVASVHKVAHEDVVGIRRRAASSEQLFQVIELSMDVPTDGDRRGDRLNVGLFQEQIADQVTELLQLWLR